MRLNQEDIEKARKASLIAVCKSFNQVLIPHHKKGEYRLFSEKYSEELIISGNQYWFEDKGQRLEKKGLEGQRLNDENNTLSFCVYFYKMPFAEAVNYINARNFPIVDNSKTNSTTSKTLIAPPQATDNFKIIQYLKQERKIAEEIVVEAINKGLLYQEQGTNNCIFVCKNRQEVITGYEVKGILKTKRYFRNYGNGIFNWLIGEEFKQLFVFESAIDLLSFYELEKGKKRLNNSLLCSMGGLVKGRQIRDIALTIKAEEIFIATDNDEEGNSFYSTFKAQNPSLKIIGIGISGTYKDNSFTGKDWNEYLVYKKEKHK